MNSDHDHKEYKGYNGTLILTGTGVIIKRGVKGFLLGGGMLRGDKTIPYSSIVAVQFKKAGLVAGYIQLTLSGGSEAKSGLFQSTTDENSINFHNWSDTNKKFTEAKSLIEQRIHTANSVSTTHSNLDELEKLARLKEKGIISEKEFQAKKKQLLDS
ncbi:MAG TPA: SHOCT domain-containing protein [Candidatus Magasanikbacteria bacterium]|nr:SHOCT domain-containing protein [Candidatus Magasanikbacteria bacterium]